ncbi:Plasmodium vivax Vir protein, putative [Plasmodium vivax]|uniref:Vir protein, putative n=1 Tax=Plasmodium vivax TaxID=5855 RepID=A0A1G4GUS1_PLAVI|nr:Plasmodium vivax Vir protein, putative [Plasmodium vivax]
MLDLEKAAQDVKLDQMYEDFFKKSGKSAAFDKNCNVFDKVGKTNPEAKKLCSELVYFLEKIREKSIKEESNKYCNYLPYWLYEKIYNIEKSPKTKIDKITFYEDLINAGKEIKGTNLKSTCPLSKLKDVDLNELKYRKLSYIYFKNFEKIKEVITSQKKDECTKYLTYLESFKSVHDRYNNDHCESFFSWSWNGTDYFPCKDKQNLSSFISDLVKCKNGDTSDPKALPAGNVKGKGDSGPAPTGDKKGSEGAAGQKASAGPAGQKASAGQAGQKASEGSTSSSSSSTTVSTSTAGGKNNKCSHYKKYGNYNKFIKSRRYIIIFIFFYSIKTIKFTTNINFRSFTNFYKYIEYKSFNKASYYNRYIKCKKFGGYSNHKSSRIESSINPKKRKKKAFEHNYYEEYEKELAKYESYNESLDSLEDRYYLTYQPDQDSHY